MNDPNVKPAPYYVRKGGGYINHIVVDGKVLCGEKSKGGRGRFRVTNCQGSRVCANCQNLIDKLKE